MTPAPRYSSAAGAAATALLEPTASGEVLICSCQPETCIVPDR
jgi:hypothetical protein